jgi:hypothetical protein
MAFVEAHRVPPNQGMSARDVLDIPDNGEGRDVQALIVFRAYFDREPRGDSIANVTQADGPEVTLACRNSSGNAARPQRDCLGMTELPPARRPVTLDPARSYMTGRHGDNTLGVVRLDQERDRASRP